MGLCSGVLLRWQDCGGDMLQKNVRGGICSTLLLFLPRFELTLLTLPPSFYAFRDSNKKCVDIFLVIEDALRCETGLLFRRESSRQIWLLSAFYFGLRARQCS